MWSAFFSLFVGETFQRVSRFIQTTADKVFLRGKYDYYRELSDLTSQIPRVLSMENILNTLQKAFYAVLEASNPRIYLEKDFGKPEVKPLLDMKEICFAGSDLVIPSRIEDRPIAILVLGPKLSEDPYTEEDLRLLRALASQTAVAIDHTHTYEMIKKDYDANEKKLVDTERQLARSEKIASMAGLIQEYNHQVKTPLAIIRGRIEMLFDKTRDEEYLKNVQKIVLEQIDRANYIVESTLRLSRPRERQETQLDLGAVVEAALSLFPPGGVRIVKDLTPGLALNGDREDLETIFINLFKNAVEAMPKGGELKIKTYSAEENGEHFVFAEVSDTGAGIAPENMDKIFEPFFSTNVTGGRGLGLSIVFRIVREHLGKIEVKSKVGSGSTFTLKLPAKN